MSGLYDHVARAENRKFAVKCIVYGALSAVFGAAVAWGPGVAIFVIGLIAFVIGVAAKLESDDHV